MREDFVLFLNESRLDQSISYKYRQICRLSTTKVPSYLRRQMPYDINIKSYHTFTRTYYIYSSLVYFRKQSIYESSLASLSYFRTEGTIVDDHPPVSLVYKQVGSIGCFRLFLFFRRLLVELPLLTSIIRTSIHLRTSLCLTMILSKVLLSKVASQQALETQLASSSQLASSRADYLASSSQLASQPAASSSQSSCSLF